MHRPIPSAASPLSRPVIAGSRRRSHCRRLIHRAGGRSIARRLGSGFVGDGGCPVDVRDRPVAFRWAGRRRLRRPPARRLQRARGPRHANLGARGRPRRAGPSGRGLRRGRGASYERLLEKGRRVLDEPGPLGLDQLQEPPSLVRTLRTDRQPDTDLVVRGLESVRPRLLGELLKDLGQSSVQGPAVALPAPGSGDHVSVSCCLGPDRDAWASPSCGANPRAAELMQ